MLPVDQGHERDIDMFKFIHSIPFNSTAHRIEPSQAMPGQARLGQGRGVKSLLDTCLAGCLNAWMHECTLCAQDWKEGESEGKKERKKPPPLGKPALRSWHFRRSTVASNCSPGNQQNWLDGLRSGFLAWENGKAVGKVARQSLVLVLVLLGVVV